MARLMVIGDTHCRYDLMAEMIARELAEDPQTSAVLHVGDMGLYDAGSLARLTARERELIEKHANPVHLAYAYLEGRASFALPVLGIPGNHEDFTLVEGLERGELALPGFTLLPPGGSAEVPLGSRSLRVMGLGRIGAPEGGAHPRRAKYIQPEHLARAVKRGQAASPDILLLHDPPALAQAGGRRPFGSRQLTELITGIRPGLVICGHMHFEYTAEIDGIPVVGVGYGAMGRYGVLDAELRLSFRDLAGRQVTPRAVEAATPPPPPPPPPSREDRARARLQRMPLPITARQIRERLCPGKLSKRARRVLDAFLADLRRAFVDRGGMSEEEAWARAEVFVRESGLKER